MQRYQARSTLGVLLSVNYDETPLPPLGARVLESIFDGAPFGIAVYDTSPQYVCVRHNRPFLDLLGEQFQDAGSVVGVSLQELTDEATFRRIQAIFDQVRLTGERFSVDEFAAVVLPDPQPRYFKWSLTPVEEEGKVRWLVATTVEVTNLVRAREEADSRREDRAQLFEALRRSKERYRELFENANDLVYTTDLEGRITTLNRAAEIVCGYTRDEAVGMNVESLLTPESAVLARRMTLRKIRHGGPTTYEVTLIAKDGRRVPLEVSSRLIYVSGQPVGVQGIARDITERQHTEQRLRFLADAGALLPASLDVQGTLTSVARVAVSTVADWSVVYLAVPHSGSEAAMDGIPGTEGETQTGSDHSSDLAVERIVVAHRDPAKEALVQEYEQRYPPTQDQPAMLWRVLRTGQPVLVPEISDEALARAARDPDHLRLLQQLQVRSAIWVPLVARGRTLGVIGLFIAEVGRRYAKEDLVLAEEIARRAALAVDNARLYAEAQEAIRARDEFLSVAAHELRTPVTVIKGTADFLLRSRTRGRLDEARLDRFLRAFRESGDRLTELTEELLDVSRLQTGQFTLRLQPTDPGAFVQQVIDRYRDHFSTRHALKVDLTASRAVLMDPDRLEQVLANLLTNAVKYSPDGGRIDVSLRPEDGGTIISVADQGIGLPPGATERIFEPFGRAPNAAERQIPGMGLGLHIARGIVERHGGRIWAESPGEGKGTTVNLWLPDAPDAQGAPVALGAAAAPSHSEGSVPAEDRA